MVEKVEKYVRISVSLHRNSNGNFRGFRNSKTKSNIDFIIRGIYLDENIDEFLNGYGNMTINDLIEKSKEANIDG